MFCYTSTNKNLVKSNQQESAGKNDSLSVRLNALRSLANIFEGPCPISMLLAVNYFQKKHLSEAAVSRCSLKKVFWKYAANLLENTHEEVQFQAILLKSHFGMGVLLQICCIFLRTPFPKNTSGRLLLTLNDVLNTGF